MFLRSQQEDGYHKLCRQEHLNDCIAVSQCSVFHEKAYSHKPCTTEVPPPRVVDTFIGPGNVARTTPAAAIDPKTCEMKMREARIHPMAPIRAIPRVTAGLNKPPDTRKNTQALTAKLKPNPSAIYVSALALGT